MPERWWDESEAQPRGDWRYAPGHGYLDELRHKLTRGRYLDKVRGQLDDERFGPSRKDDKMTIATDRKHGGIRRSFGRELPPYADRQSLDRIREALGYGDWTPELEEALMRMIKDPAFSPDPFRSAIGSASDASQFSITTGFPDQPRANPREEMIGKVIADLMRGME